jgi:hypothetical protein
MNTWPKRLEFKQKPSVNMRARVGAESPWGAGISEGLSMVYSESNCLRYIRRKDANSGIHNKEVMKLRINEIWEISLLKKKVHGVQAELKEGQDDCFLDENGNLARMIEMISPISYHQAEEIAGFLGMGYEQSSLNEDEMETLDWAVKMKMENLLFSSSLSQLAPFAMRKLLTLKFCPV